MTEDFQNMIAFIIIFIGLACYRADQNRRKRAAPGRGRPWKWDGHGWR